MNIAGQKHGKRIAETIVISNFGKRLVGISCIETKQPLSCGKE